MMAMLTEAELAKPQAAQTPPPSSEDKSKAKPADKK
jgi:hypothetical protein